MKKILLHISLIAVFTAFAFDASCQKSAFSGTWKLDRTKSVLPEYISVLTQITVKMKADSILTERYYDVGDGQEYPFDENLPLNGSNVSITIYDMPRKTNVTFSDMDNTVSLTSTTTFYDSGTPIDFNSKETQKIDQANIMTISFVNKSSQGEATGQFVLNKVSQ